jgi:predicted GTPase
VRTGCGKSAVSRYVVRTLRDMGLRVAALRHPMPYGNLSDQVVQRFETLEDLKRHNCTIEEMEEYEPHIQAGNLIFAGADYARILAEAEKEADVILWDGGNNDTAFIKPDLYITLLDPLRPGHELDYFPGRWNVERADVQVMTKIDEARPVDAEAVRENALKLNPDAPVIEGHSPIELADPSMVEGKRVVVIEDGPTVTHGGMGYGAGFLAAKRAGAAEIVDPRPFVRGEIASAFEVYSHLDRVLPALGYGERQLADLEQTINSIDCDAVVIGTPIDLTRILKIEKPTVRVTYSFKESEGGKLTSMVKDKFGK